MPHLSFRSSCAAGLAGALLAFLGCGGGGGSASAGGSAANGAIQIRLATSKSSYALGETVNFTLTMSNLTSQMVPFDMCTYPGIASPITAIDGVEHSGLEIWADGGNGCELLAGSFAPHEVRVHMGSWNQTDANGNAVAPGVYFIQSTILAGVITSTGETPYQPKSNVVTFTIK